MPTSSSFAPRDLLLVGDAREALRSLPVGCIHLAVTSPPYFGLRAYGGPLTTWGGDAECEHAWVDTAVVRKGSTSGREDLGSTLVSVGGAKTPAPGKDNDVGGTKQYRKDEADTCEKCGAWRGYLGLEPSPELYIAHLVEVFAEVWRVLRDDGVLLLNLGDSYQPDHVQRPRSNMGLNARYARTAEIRIAPPESGLKRKDLIGIPWMAAFALRQAGWYLRSEIIWAKGASGQRELIQQVAEAATSIGLAGETVAKLLAELDPYVGGSMPEAPPDRVTRTHEQVFLLAKRPSYFFDVEAITESAVGKTHHDLTGGKYTPPGQTPHTGSREQPAVVPTRRRRSVWLVQTRPYKGAHTAVFPPDLVRPMVLAGTSEQGCCSACGAPRVRVRGRPCAVCSAFVRRHHKVCSRCGSVREWKEGRIASEELRSPTFEGASGRHTPRNPGGFVSPEVDGGWEPSCPCEGADLVPCTVLDPFAGSGTALMVARELGRRFVGIELKREFAGLVQERVGGELEVRVLGGETAGGKTCPKCGEDKPLAEFGHRRMKGKGGEVVARVQSWCRACRSGRPRAARAIVGG